MIPGNRIRSMGAPSSQRGLVLLISAASLSLMGALGVAMIGAPSTALTQTAQVQAGDQALLNAESGYHYAMSLIRHGGLSAIEARSGESFATGAGSFRVDLVERAGFHFAFSTGGGDPAILNPTDDLHGIQLPQGQTLPRLNGRFSIDGVEYRYASYAEEAGVMFGVERTDGAPGVITIPDDALLVIPGRFDVVSVGMFESAERSLVRVAGPGACNSSLVLVSDEQTLANGTPAVATWDAHQPWTARLADATWIWDSHLEPDPMYDLAVIFEREFTLPSGAGQLKGTIAIAADNSYICTINGNGEDRLASGIETNYFMENIKVFAVNDLLAGGSNLLRCDVLNWAQPERGTAHSNPAGLLFRMDVNFQQ